MGSPGGLGELRTPNAATRAAAHPGVGEGQRYSRSRVVPVCREDILLRAYRLSKSNDGTPGVDGETFEDIESGGPQGVREWLNGLGKDLHDKTYRPQPVRRVMIEKPEGGERPLGIPTIRDRVAQTAAKLILESIFGKRIWSRMLMATGQEAGISTLP